MSEHSLSEHPLNELAPRALRDAELDQLAGELAPASIQGEETDFWQVIAYGPPMGLLLVMLFGAAFDVWLRLAAPLTDASLLDWGTRVIATLAWAVPLFLLGCVFAYPIGVLPALFFFWFKTHCIRTFGLNRVQCGLAWGIVCAILGWGLYWLNTTWFIVAPVSFVTGCLLLCFSHKLPLQRGKKPLQTSDTAHHA